VIRQELAAEQGIVVSLRTVRGAVAPYRQVLVAEARALVDRHDATTREVAFNARLKAFTKH